jgi:hypothetical protein
VFIRTALVLLALTAAASAANCYVATNGSDSDSGTIGSPFATLEAFDATAQPGDTCFMRGGTYTPAATIILGGDGQSARPICLFAYPGEQPTIDGRNATNQAALRLYDANWWHVKGIEITNTQQEWICGLRIGGTSSNITLEQLNTHHCSFVGSMISGDVADILVLNCDSHHNVDADYEDADGFQVYPDTHARIVYRGCRAWNNADDGWDFFFGTAGSVYMEHCWAFRNGYDDGGAELGDGNGFKLGGATSDPRVASSGGHTLVRCVAWGNKYCGFNENTDTGASPDTLYHCTGYDNRGWRDYDFDTGLRHVLKNNLTFTTNGAATDISVSENNSWDLSLALTNGDFVSLDETGTDGPRQTGGSLPVLDFLRPTAGAAQVDRGVDIGLPYEGDDPDLGAFEYTPVATRAGVGPTTLRTRRHLQQVVVTGPGPGPVGSQVFRIDGTLTGGRLPAGTYVSPR